MTKPLTRTERNYVNRARALLLDWEVVVWAEAMSRNDRDNMTIYQVKVRKRRGWNHADILENWLVPDHRVSHYIRKLREVYGVNFSGGRAFYTDATP